jgi:hypothetical protein
MLNVPEAKGMNLPARFLTSLARGFQKSAAVLVIGENGFAPAADISNFKERRCHRK